MFVCLIWFCLYISRNCANSKVINNDISEQDDFKKAQCSQHCGGNGECLDDGRCTFGCRSGYYGSICILKCSENCANEICSEKGTCTFGCLNRYFGLNCNSSCSPSCALDGSCNHLGRCNFGCQTGGDCTVQKDCSGNCDGDGSCYTNGTCKFGCKPGFYSPDCTLNCTKNCAENESCHLNGTCLFGCDPGFYGDNCTSECNNSCGGNQSCPLNGICKYGCKSGFYGPDCKLNCSENCAVDKSCDINGTCRFGCHAPFFGYNCSTECSDSCGVDQSCFLNGTCKYGCKIGVYGMDCELNCSENCATDKRCDENGTCWYGCRPSFFGHNCSSECSNSCGGDKSCLLNGTCVYGCKPGFYGLDCKLNCSEHCADDKSCFINGTCRFGCRTGFFGNNCSSKCNDTCDGDRSGFLNGTCKNECTEGFYGPNCNLKCNDTCDGDRSCFLNGTCKNECTKGFYGPNCNLKCNPGCAKDGSCDSSQVCLHGCWPGYYGIHCSKFCSTCNVSCDMNGNCLHGCQPGFFGKSCTSDCSPYCAKYGDCDLNGSCTHGCEPGYFGPKCFQLGLSSNRSENETWNCHCRGEKCTDRFDICSEFDDCITGWFGFHCDYRDIGVTAKMSSQYLNDNDIKTCYEPPKNTVRAEWTTPVWFTWAWLTFRNDSNVSHLSLVVENDKGTHRRLSKQLKIKNITSNILEILYLGVIRMSTLVIYWTGQASLCSLSVNGDHNLALAFTTLPPLPDYRLLKRLNKPITDGDLSGDHCVDFQKQSYTDLVYSFNHAVWISTIKVYPDINKQVNGTLQFIFKTHSKSNKIKSYGFLTGKKVSMFTFYLPVLIESLKIKVVNGSAYVCEMEIFGECDPPNYGFGCREICSITCLGERCDYRGQCLRCIPGRIGPHCMEYQNTVAVIETTQSNKCDSRFCSSNCGKTISQSLYFIVHINLVFWIITVL